MAEDKVGLNHLPTSLCYRVLMVLFSVVCFEELCLLERELFFNLIAICFFQMTLPDAVVYVFSKNFTICSLNGLNIFLPDLLSRILRNTSTLDGSERNKLF